MDLISVDGEGSKRKREELLDELVDNEPAKRTPHDFKIADFRDEDEPADEKANDSEGDEDKDDDEKDTVAVFDEEKFFLSPSFTPEELADASNRINAAFQAPLRCLEKGGHTVYMDFLKEREMKARINNIDKSEQMQQMIEDATIQGDPRGYQQALFQIAKRKNTIINLGTGYGKTLIALLCIRHFSQAFEEGKHTLFLVPSVALAIQQSTTLRANLPNYSIQTACYASSNSEGARQALAKSNVIVATHGAILDLLMHYADMFQISRFNLLVIDECHYATGNHAYAVILNKFYHSTPKEERPRVLGLTASPLVNVKENHSDEQLAVMLSNLENTLDASLAPTSGLVSEFGLGLLMKSAQERVVDYHGTNVGRAIPSADNLDLHESRYREFRQLNQLYTDLGPLVLTLYCTTLVRELSRNEFENETAQQFNRAVNHLRHIATFCEQEYFASPNNGRTDKLLALEELLEGEIEKRSGAETVGLIFVERRITAMALHNYFRWRSEEADKTKLARAKTLRHAVADPFPQVQLCKDGEESQYDDSADDPFVTFQAPHTGTPNIQIGETQDRTTMIDSTSHEHDQFMDADGDNLSFIDHGRKNLDHPPIAENCRQVETEGCQGAVKTAVLVRNSTQIFRSLCIGRKFSNEGKQEQRKTWIHQETKVREVLRKLRRGEVNVLIATSVVEEGVDVQACSFVAVFDSLKNTKGYIQMKGRARQKNAKFFVFQDINEVKSTLPLSMAQEMERRVHNFIERKTISDLSPEEFQRETSPEKTKDKVLPSELEALSNGFFKVENGTVDLHSAKSLLNRYALSVPLDPFARTSKESLLAHMPIYDSDQLILPSHLPNNVRVVKLPSDYSHFPKKEKQKLLSLMACVRLHSFGLLNERLLPLTHRDMQRHILRLATKELPTTSPQVLPLDKFFKEGVCRVYVIPLHQTSPTFSRFENVLKGKGHTLALVTFEPLSLSIPPRKMRHAEFGVVNLEFGRVSVVECTQEERRILSQIYILLLNERWRRRSRNMYFRFLEKQEYSGSILPYLLGILTREGSLDFDLMKALLVEGARSKEERINAVRKRSNDDPLDEPRLWCPLYDEHVSYIAIGPSGENCTAIFPHEKEGVKTYHDYFVKYREFELSSGSPLFDVQRLWSLPSNLPILSDEEVFRPTTIKTTAAKYTVCGELASVKLAQTACLEALLANSHIALLCSMLPQFLFVYERFLNTKAFIDFCLLHLPTLGKSLSSLPLEKVATAITAKSCSLDDCYEKLEWFGDAVLKIVQTDTLLKSIELRQWIPFLHEGDLSTLRSAMGSNDRLEKVCRHLQLNRFVMTAPLARGQWLPACIHFTEGTELKAEDSMGTKIYADIVESILGLVYLEFGYAIALNVGGELGVTLQWEDPSEESARSKKGNEQLLTTVHHCTGYHDFKKPELVDEAFTHPSANHPSVPSYQRLEWVGDAVLCLAMREWIYKNFAWDTSLGEMVVFEAALVSNETLAFLSIKNALQHNLNHRDHSLPSRIESYSWKVQNGSGLWGADPPKAISDIVEAVFGAVHVDGGFSAGQRGVLHLMAPIFKVLLKARNEGKEISLKHPKKVMQELGGDLFELSSSRESDFFAIHANRSTDILCDKKWNKAHPDGGNFVATVELLGSTMLAVSDPSATVGRNRACYLITNTLQTKPELLAQLHAVRTKVERGVYLAAHSTEASEKNDETD